MTIRTRDGYPVPELAAWLTGTREADRLAELGVIVNREQARLTELGRAVIEHEPMPDPASLAPLLAQLRDRNQTQRRDLDQRPTPDNRLAEAGPVAEKRGLDHGRVDSERRAQQPDPVRNADFEIGHFLKESHDDREDWT